MNKYDILIAIKEIQCRYSLPAFEKNFTDKDYACKQYEKLVINLANQQEEKDKEIERLNNVINELEKYIIENEKINNGAIKCSLSSNSEIKEMEIENTIYDNILDKLYALKEGDKDE